MNFLRQINLDVGPAGQSGVRISDLRIAFEVTKTDLAYTNSMFVRIWNLSSQRATQLQSLNNTVVLSAGYKDILSVVGVGLVTGYETIKSGADWITTLACSDSVQELSSLSISLSFKGLVTSNQIIDAIAAKLNIVAVNKAPTYSFRNGYSFCGSAKEALTQLAKSFMFDWSIQNSELIILPKNQGDSTKSVLINSQTGLLSPPRIRDRLALEYPDSSELSLQIDTILNPAIEATGLITLSEGKYQGNYRVESVTHRGDLGGDTWISRVIARGI